MEDVIIIGGGPAGLSAALYTLRGGKSTTVIGKDGGALWKAREVENYFGASSQPSGRELVETGRGQVRALGGTFLEEEVTALEWTDHFTVTTTRRTLQARSVILATGASRATLPIPGLKELEGRGVSYCAVCDAFFYRGKRVAVLGAGPYARHEADALLPVAAEVTLLTNGQTLGAQFPGEVAVESRPVARVLGEGKVSGVELQGGAVLPCDGLFVALGSAGGVELARKLGLPVEGSKITVDAAMATMIPGLFAAGDCVSNIQQASVAVGQGAIAGLSALNYLRTLN